MFRTPRFLEKVDYERINLDTPLTLPGNDQNQTKTGLMFSIKDRDIIRDRYDACFRVEYELQALANGALGASTQRSALSL